MIVTEKAKYLKQNLEIESLLHAGDRARITFSGNLAGVYN